MRVLVAIGLSVLFGLGAAVGLVLGVVAIFWISLIRGARAVHADGVICRAELIARDARIGAPLAGAALVRLSGAFGGQGAARDVLGLDVRLQRVASVDPDVGDQDLLLGSFESFHTAPHDLAATDAVDFLDDHYSSVTPWWLPGVGPATLRLIPPAKQPPERGADRLARLDVDLAADRARLALVAEHAGSTIQLAELRLIERLAIDGRGLRASMFRTGRGVRPVGFRNGIRATVYPISQLARRLRGG